MPQSLGVASCPASASCRVCLSKDVAILRIPLSMKETDTDKLSIVVMDNQAVQKTYQCYSFNIIVTVSTLHLLYGWLRCFIFSVMVAVSS